MSATFTQIGLTSIKLVHARNFHGILRFLIFVLGSFFDVCAISANLFKSIAPPPPWQIFPWQVFIFGDFLFSHAAQTV